jgi:uncharacterized protein
VITAHIRVYAELNDFLSSKQRQTQFVREIRFPTSVKDLLEGAGIPHPEIALILVDDERRSFDYLVDRDCRVAAYPRFHTLSTRETGTLQPKVPPVPGFVLDVHLGRLARYLRLLGFDTLYDNAADDNTLVDRSCDGERILLTRDRGLLMRREVVHGYYVRENEPRKQLAETVRRFKLAAVAQPFTRCMNCNGRLSDVEKVDVEQDLEPGTRRHFDRFWRCQECGNIYWEGSHFERLVHEVANALDASGQASTPRMGDGSGRDR